MKYPQEQYPKISVITVVYNGAKFIERAINSLISQNYPNLEYLVLDAGSKDGTVEIISKYNNHISYFRSHKDNGPHDAINEGIDKATGDVIALLNSDDYFNDGILLKIGEAFIENPEMEMVNVNGQIVCGDSGKVLKTSSRSMDISSEKVEMIRPNCRFYKKSLFEKYGKFIDMINGKPAHFADYEFITRLSLHNPKNISINELGYIYVTHENSLTFNANEYTKLKIFDENTYYISELLKNYPHLISEKQKKRFNKKLKKSLTGKVVRNLVDKNFNAAKENLKYGISKFGLLLPISVIKLFLSYNLKVAANKFKKN